MQKQCPREQFNIWCFQNGVQRSFIMSPFWGAPFLNYRENKNNGTLYRCQPYLKCQPIEFRRLVNNVNINWKLADIFDRVELETSSLCYFFINRPYIENEVPLVRGFYLKLLFKPPPLSPHKNTYISTEIRFRGIWWIFFMHQKSSPLVK